MATGLRRHVAGRGQKLRAIRALSQPGCCAHTHSAAWTRSYSAQGDDPRLREIHDEYATIRECYATPRDPVVLAHGLMGFAEVRVAGGFLPTIQYWRGIADALKANGVKVITVTVPPCGSIEQRAEELARGIAAAAPGQRVNVVAHSMGGLDARYMISRLRPPDVNVGSLVTIASPHRGSAFADYVFDEIGVERLPGIYRFVERLGMDTGAFEQLTRAYMTQEFNPRTPDHPDVHYFSYGAMMDRPSLFSPFRRSHRIIGEAEGPNDGLVSVESSIWGTYMGTLFGVSHLDLINWTNRLGWILRKWMGQGPTFNAIAFYLDITDRLAQKGF
ncbi:alpha/beta-hydrolase [Durotheca rogersii]|uniref:alpha/beta-hydrolase n=1 Tax=Durotheca rogersii TaxID=419775 RepID=UPI002220C9E2|nr:alpha/beta-hydrolase [Durotheca rogersii]KAI5855009.1 alpha/beta-hydrolase [Durotheca rogersii]